ALNVVLAQLLELFLEFLAGVFAELSHVDVRDAGLEPDGFRNTRPRDRIADNVEAKGLGVALAADFDLYLGAPWPLEEIRDLRGIEYPRLFFVRVNQQRA